VIFDVVLVGGGFVGCALARGLRQRGLSVALIEKQEKSLSDNRVFALGLDILQWLEEDLNLGPFPKSPIESIVLSFEGSPDFCSFQRSDMRKEVPALGFMLESRVLHSVLQKEKEENPLYCPDNITEINARDSHAVCIRLSSGATLKARLLIAADGGQSGVRQILGPAYFSEKMSQRAMTFTVQSQKTHTTAYEHFFKGGSLAFLPMLQNRLAVVWSDQSPVIEEAMHCPEKKVLATLQSLMPVSLALEHIVSEKTAFPIYSSWAGRIVFPRCILLGDAAHVLHPLLGQGLNVGLREARQVLEGIMRMQALGLDWGMASALKSFIKRRHAVLLQGTTLALVHGLSLNNSRLLWEAVRWGMKSSFLRSFVVRQAGGE
jgi:ubiquinone biosynthesis UbiH/UbiF/VisC/COQ6 family hydroxylase